MVTSGTARPGSAAIAAMQNANAQGTWNSCCHASKWGVGKPMLPVQLGGPELASPLSVSNSQVEF